MLFIQKVILNTSTRHLLPADWGINNVLNGFGLGAYQRKKKEKYNLYHTVFATYNRVISLASHLDCCVRTACNHLEDNRLRIWLHFQTDRKRELKIRREQMGVFLMNSEVFENADKHYLAYFIYLLNLT